MKFERDPRYLSDEDLTILTGRCRKRDQATQLQKMDIPFVLNGVGTPLVPVLVIEGSPAQGRRAIKNLEAYFAELRLRDEMAAKMRRQR
ncbi:DUF4224 domain-containing protein [Duganella sp. BJB1802]|uniref:DUF4224 domain-containing protein n=1 Tax=Duganella sp. BJB1802 TaxID=2744575 RepID=UPI0015937E4C|nr:DUF4224 domain-containing protein [Duganella sp. BJB1802]NVD74518.1 DUF4224 domain-containing protein [Duganella sp. BJB1802]